MAPTRTARSVSACLPSFALFSIPYRGPHFLAPFCLRACLVVQWHPTCVSQVQSSATSSLDSILGYSRGEDCSCVMLGCVRYCRTAAPSNSLTQRHLMKRKIDSARHLRMPPGSAGLAT